MRKMNRDRSAAVKQPGISHNPAAHLARYKFPRGVSGNPNGRPKKETPSETLRFMLASEYGVEGSAEAIKAMKAIQAGMPEPWTSRGSLTVQEIMTWVLLRRAMQSAGDNARKEVFDRVEGRPTLKIAGPTGGPIETVSYDLKKLSTEKIKAVRAILAEAVITESEQD